MFRITFPDKIQHLVSATKLASPGLHIAVPRCVAYFYVHEFLKSTKMCRQRERDKEWVFSNSIVYEVLRILCVLRV